ncbi:MAG: DUF998 domain-containing protein [Propionicimonas sp.]|uniref:DUF998 domain-containing protein n=1 Tax=Propionicimonas sp. TaxID=1955623 RepID=UPI003D129282
MSTTRPGLVAGVAGPSLFVVVLLLEGWLRPGYSPLAEYVSALSLGPRGWIQVVSFVVTGACLLWFAAALAREFPTGAASRAGPVLVGIIGACLLLSGPFVMDPAGTPTGAMTTHGLVHGILGAIVFLLMPVVPFVLLRRLGREPTLHGLWWPTLVLGVFIAVADVVFTVATKVPTLAAATAPWAGLLQRLVLVPFMAWVLLLATGLLRRA